MRTCQKCKQEKDESLFYKCKARKDGLDNWCTQCRRENYVANKDKTSAYWKKKYAENPEKYRERKKKWKVKNKDRDKIRERQRKRENKIKVVERYGGKCACCGETQIEFLTIDHIHGGGNKERRTASGSHIYQTLLKTKPDFSKYRVLCFNCNQSRGFYGYCPHERPDEDFITSNLRS